MSEKSREIKEEKKVPKYEQDVKDLERIDSTCAKAGSGDKFCSVECW